MSIDELYEAGDDYKAGDYIDVPGWIEPDITAHDVAAILQGGCESGAYMPAVTYHQALDTMRQHGDEVFDHLESAMGEIPQATGRHAESWSGLACFYLSCAVEIWASAIEDELTESIRDEIEESHEPETETD